MALFEVLETVAVISAISAVLGSDYCPSQHGVPRSCPPMWQLWRNACYRLTESPATWDDSWPACRSMGGRMAAPRSLEEMKFMAELAGQIGSSYYVWIACTDKQAEGTWVCDGQEDSKPFLKWSPGQPDNLTNQDCAAIHGNFDGNMDDGKCHSTHRAICIHPKTRPSRYCFSTDTHGRILDSTCLIDHGIREFTTHSVTTCGSACIKEPGCRSFNIKKTQDGKNICQLNNSTSSEDKAKFQNTGYFCIYSEVCNN